MPKRKSNRGGSTSPKEDQIGHDRPTHFEEDEGYKRTLRKLAASERVQVVPQLKKFKEEWRDPRVTGKDLNSTWGYKALQGAPKNENVMQIRLSNHRVALLVITKKNPCVWLLEIFRKTGKKNQKELDRVTERARRIRREQE